MNCNVCVSSFNKTKNRCVKCPYCEYDVCRNCCETYLLSRTEEAHCMNCKREWNRKILLDNFTKKFVDTTYKKHKGNVLFDKEKALLPETQIHLYKMIEIAKLNHMLRKLQRRYKIINNARYDPINENNLPEIMIEMKQIRNEKKELKEKIFELEQNKTLTKSNFVRTCPDDNCRGFLSAQWYCGICCKKTCAECHELKADNHVCKKENIAAAKLIEKDTRPCPKCGIRIYKIDGCDQMWCTQCHTAFSWKTGNVELKIHNPHYFEWLRKNNIQERNPLDVQCGREIDVDFLRELVRMKCSPESAQVNISRGILHINLYRIPELSDRKDNQDLRMKYLDNAITEDKFKQLLQRREKDFSKKRELLNIVTMYKTACIDIMYRYMADFNDKKKQRMSTKNLFDVYKMEVNSLVDYTNQCFKEITELYNVKNMFIDSRFELVN